MQFCAILCITIESHSNFFADFSGIAPVMLSAIQGSTDVEHSQAEKVQPSSQTHEPSFGKTNATIGAWNCNLPPFKEIMTDQTTTDQPTDLRTDGSYTSMQ